MGWFIKHLETSPFCWRQFCRCTINRLGHAFPWTWNIFTNGTLIPTTYSACSYADAIFFSWNFRETFLLHVFCAHAEHFQEQICIVVFDACALHPKRTLISSSTKASATLLKNRKGHVWLLLFFHERRNPKVLRGYLYFWNALLILMIFQHKYGTATTVGMYASSLSACIACILKTFPQRPKVLGIRWWKKHDMNIFGSIQDS